MPQLPSQHGEEEENDSEEEGEDVPIQQRPPWHHLNKWTDINKYGLHQLDARDGSLTWTAMSMGLRFGQWFSLL